MTVFVPIAMFGWIPVVLGLFLVLPPRRAVLVGYIGGWLFLPTATYTFTDIPDYTKFAACSIAVLAGSLLFDRKTLASLRPRLIDVPMAVFCLCPFVTTMLTGHGPVAGVSRVLTHLFQWGIPYLVGRAYFKNWRDLRELAVAVFIGGLVYLPFVWYEIRMSPQLHGIVYGYHQHGFVHALRYGGYRPRVFMYSGLVTAMWMAAASLCGLWLWRSRSLVRPLGLPMALLVPISIVTTVLCKSANGVVMLSLGLGAFFATRWLRSPIPLLALVLVAPTYITLRATDAWSGENLVALLASDMQRAGSLSARMRQEDVYTDQAWKRPFFGWGGGGFIPRDHEGKRLVRGNDAFWIITLGLYGLVSLVSVFVALLLPALVLMFRVPASAWMTPRVAPTAGLATVTVLFAIDLLFNGMMNPVYLMAVGGLCGVRKLTAAQPASAPALGGTVSTERKTALCNSG